LGEEFIRYFPLEGIQTMQPKEIILPPDWKEIVGKLSNHNDESAQGIHLFSSHSINYRRSSKFHFQICTIHRFLI
jgi:hypothetical protein